jgi:hypothetical protein
MSAHKNTWQNNKDRDLWGIGGVQEEEMSRNGQQHTSAAWQVNMRKGGESSGRLVIGNIDIGNAVTPVGRLLDRAV